MAAHRLHRAAPLLALARVGRLAAPPEHVGLDRRARRQHVEPCSRRPSICRDAFERALDELRILEIGEIRQAQHGRRRAQLVEQQLEARPPQLAHLDRARLEHGIGEIEADDAMDRGAEVELERLAARRALHLQRCVEPRIAARQRAIVELQHEVAAAALVRRDRARDVEAAVLVRRREQAARRREPHAGDAVLAVVLHAVAVRVVEDLADDVRAVERRVRNDAHRRRRLARQRAARQRAHRLRAVHELAFADAGADGEQQLQRVPAVGRDGRGRPDELAAARRRLARHAVEPRRAFDVAEAGREAVDDGDVGQFTPMPFATVIMYGTSWPRETLHERRRLRDRDRLVEVEIERNVVVEDLARARHEAVVERQVQVVGRARRAADRRRRLELRRLRLAVLRRRGTASSIDAGHDGTANAAVVASKRRNDRGQAGEVRRGRRRHAEQIAAAARARGSAKFRVELVVAVGERDLALLVRIVEAGRRHRDAAPGVQASRSRPRSARARSQS